MPAALDPLLRSAAPPRAFGRFTLRRLVGKSDLSMVWLAADDSVGAGKMLAMPRVAPVGAAAIGNWLLAARRAARLDHPNIAKVGECSVHEQWPYIAVDRGASVTLEEWLVQHPQPAIDDATLWVESILRGLAFGHDAGVAHRDLQPHNIVINERGQASVMALGVALEEIASAPAPPRSMEGRVALRESTLRAQRLAAERDVLACGVILHRLLLGAPVLDCADVSRVLDRVAPRGREIVRLPWTTPQPIPEALRAIANRSTSAQVRLRYRNARTFLGAISGWRESSAHDDGGPVALLLDRLHSVGHLPALPGLGARVQRVTSIESQRTDEIARNLLPDMALSFELLKTLSSARVQGTQIPGNGPVLTLRRIVALIGVDGVRAAANTLRAWPGAVDGDRASALRETIDRVRLAGHLAQALRPAGYDPEAVYLVTVLQNLGWMMLRYHFADEAEQIRQLMQPVAAVRSDGELVVPEQPGLNEDGAAYAVLGVNVESFGSAAARQWGLGAEVMHMIRRLPADAPVRKPDTDNELLRIVASAANETIEALDLPPPKAAAALSEVVSRYARTLRLTTRVLDDALEDARAALRGDGALASLRRADIEDVESDADEASRQAEAPLGAPAATLHRDHDG